MCSFLFILCSAKHKFSTTIKMMVCFYFQDLAVVAIVVNKQKFRHLHFLFSERESCMSTTQKKTSSCHQKSFHVFPRHKLVLWLVGSCLFVSWRMICQKWNERKTERLREYWAFLLVNLAICYCLLSTCKKIYSTTAITFGNVHISFVSLVLEFFMCIWNSIRSINKIGFDLEAAIETLTDVFTPKHLALTLAGSCLFVT